MSLVTAIGLVGLIASPVAAFWRLPCKSPIVVERADPVVSPGKVSGHVHTIMGGNAFDFTMDYNTTQTSTCSSCTVTGDNSNYWTPTLWYQAQDGTFESVNQVGGATVYYLQRAGDNETLKAFPPGFRMVAGDPFKRSPGTDFASQGISYNCLDFGINHLETGGFPTMNCPAGLRSQVFFPSCWNGKDLDSPDHKSHVSYPQDSYNSGKCPPDFPVHLISLFYELVWDTPSFADRWYGNSQPFVWSMGDPTGFGYHGDFIMGWNEDLLQTAVDTCTNDSGRIEDCPVFNIIPDSQAAGCMVAPKVNEAVSGNLTTLPGCNPIQTGPAEAKPVTPCSATSTVTTNSSTFYTDLTGEGWAYAGCGTDNYYARILTGASESTNDMTNEKCVAFCGGKGFSVAGTEYSKECYCGNSIPATGAPIPGVVGDCQMACAGNASEYCGGSSRISLYTRCSNSTGSLCTNVNLGPTSVSVVITASSTPTTMATVTTPPTTTSAVNSTTTNPTTASTSANSSSGGSSTSTGDPSTDPTSSLSVSMPTSTGTSTPNTTIPTGWHYSGCFVDTVFPRILPTWSTFNGPNMTNAACIDFCDGRNLPIAGTEYAGECFCGDAINSTMTADTECNMPCTGDDTEICGGPKRLSVYAKDGSAKVKRVERTYGGPRRLGRAKIIF